MISLRSSGTPDLPVPLSQHPLSHSKLSVVQQTPFVLSRAVVRLANHQQYHIGTCRIFRINQRFEIDTGGREKLYGTESGIGCALETIQET